MSEPVTMPRRLVSIDALRGFAALTVVAFHATSPVPFQGIDRTQKWITLPLAFVASYGFLGVYLFFVISGFCIHLKWAKAKAAGGEPQIDFVAFWKRRFWRLYPPYLICAAIFLAVMAVEGKLPSLQFLAYDVGMHALMLHNLDIRTCHSISGVFWTLAIEEQLYLAYFLLIALRKRWGWPRTLVICFAARVIWFALAAVVHRMWDITIPATQAAASHWFVWALGAVSVEATLGIVKLPSWTRNLGLAVGIILCAAAITYFDWIGDQGTLLHKLVWLLNFPLWGVGFWVLLNYYVTSEGSWKVKSPRFAGALAAVGLFSYSLYLTNELLLVHAAEALPKALGMSADAGVALTLYLLAPLSVLLAWVFFLLFERPFLNKVGNSVRPQTCISRS